MTLSFHNRNVLKHIVEEGVAIEEFNIEFGNVLSLYLYALNQNFISDLASKDIMQIYISIHKQIGLSVAPGKCLAVVYKRDSFWERVDNPKRQKSPQDTNFYGCDEVKLAEIPTSFKR